MSWLHDKQSVKAQLSSRGDQHWPKCEDKIQPHWHRRLLHRRDHRRHFLDQQLRSRFSSFQSTDIPVSFFLAIFWVRVHVFSVFVNHDENNEKSISVKVRFYCLDPFSRIHRKWVFVWSGCFFTGWENSKGQSDGLRNEFGRILNRILEQFERHSLVPGTQLPTQVSLTKLPVKFKVQVLATLFLFTSEEL